MDPHMVEAQAIHRLLGEHGSLWLTECIAALASVGDSAGVDWFQTIATRYRNLPVAAA